MVGLDYRDGSGRVGLDQVGSERIGTGCESNHDEPCWARIGWAGMVWVEMGWDVTACTETLDTCIKHRGVQVYVGRGR